MYTKIIKTEKQSIAIISGRLDTAASQSLAEDIKPLMQQNGKDIVLDLTDLNYISSSALRVFLTMRKESKKNGYNIIVKGMNPEIQQIFTITGFSTLFTIQ